MVAGGGLTAVTAFVCARALVLELVVSSLRLDASLFVFPSRERARAQLCLPLPSAAVWSMPHCRVLWFFSINYLRKKIELTLEKFYHTVKL